MIECLKLILIHAFIFTFIIPIIPLFFIIIEAALTPSSENQYKATEFRIIETKNSQGEPRFYPEYKHKGKFYRCYKTWGIAGGDEHIEVVAYGSKNGAQNYINSKILHKEKYISEMEEII